MDSERSQRSFHIVVVGLGGTGGYLAELLGHLLSADAQGDGGARLKATFVDGDKVESVNLLRQNFYPDDLGRNKAQALAEALNASYGLHVASSDAYLHGPEDLDALVEGDENVIVVGAVDNNASRAAIEQFVSSRAHTVGLDAGNNVKDGQVVVYGDTDLLGYDGLKALGVAADPPRTPLDLFPELRDFSGLNANPDDQSCELHAVHSPQNMGTNMAAGLLLFLLIAKLYTGDSLGSYLYRFDIAVPSAGPAAAPAARADGEAPSDEGDGKHEGEGR